MNYEKIGTATGCEEILDELPSIVGNFVLDLEEEYKCTASKYLQEIQNLELQITKLAELQKKTAAEKVRLKEKAEEFQYGNDSSFFIYSDKELQDELSYNNKVIKYAKSKIRLYELCTKMSWDPTSFSGKILSTSQSFDFTDLPPYDQVNNLWELL